MSNALAFAKTAPEHQFPHATAERWQHGSEPAEGCTHRVGNGLAALRKAGKISDADVAAAERWYMDYALGVMGVFDAEPGRSAGDGDAHTAGFARAKAAQAFREASAAVGAQGMAILRRFVADNWTLISVGESLGMDRKAAAGAVIVTLRRVTEHYAAKQPIGRQTDAVSTSHFSS